MKRSKRAEVREKEMGPPNLNCNHDGAYALQEGIPLRYCPNCQLISTGSFGKYSIYMHPDVLKDLAKIEAQEPMEWEALHQALVEIATFGEQAGEPEGH